MIYVKKTLKHWSLSPVSALKGENFTKTFGCYKKMFLLCTRFNKDAISF